MIALKMCEEHATRVIGTGRTLRHSRIEVVEECDCTLCKFAAKKGKVSA